MKLKVLIPTLLLTFSSIAADNGRGYDIAAKVKSNDTGWVNTSAQMEMILKNASGDESSRKMRVNTLEVANDGDMSLTIFDTPRDISGTIFLSHSHIDTDDAQWIYLPAIRRAKRISTSNKSGPFMGSEFAYEDIASFELSKYDFEFISEEDEYFVIQQIPTTEYSGYSRQVVWIDKENYYIKKIYFYDVKNTLLKVLTMDDFKKYKDQFWRASISHMKNVQTNKETTLILEDIRFSVDMDDSDFTVGAIRRMK